MVALHGPMVMMFKPWLLGIILHAFSSLFTLAPLSVKVGNIKHPMELIIHINFHINLENVNPVFATHNVLPD